MFGSILAVAKELKGRGYDLGDVDPAQMEAEDLMDMVLNDKEAKFDSCVFRVFFRDAGVASMTSGGERAVGGLFFDFGAVRTESSVREVARLDGVDATHPRDRTPRHTPTPPQHDTSQEPHT